MKPIEAFLALINRVMFTGLWKRPERSAPGKVVESMSLEQREALSKLKSDDIAPDKLRVKDYWMMGPDYEKKVSALDFEKNMGIKPPPRKKYED